MKHRYTSNLLRASKGITETNVADTTKIKRRKSVKKRKAKPEYEAVVSVEEVAYDSGEETELEDNKSKVTAKGVEPENEEESTNGGPPANEIEVDSDSSKSSADEEGKGSDDDDDEESE